MMSDGVMPAYDELVAELITLRAVLDARKFVRIARAADDAIDRALSLSLIHISEPTRPY